MAGRRIVNRSGKTPQLNAQVDGKMLETFLHSRAKVDIIQGPVGCLGGSTLVVTEFGPIPISQIDRPMRVLSWNGKTNRFQLSWCGGSFPKGRDYLVRVSTPLGGFDASERHLMLCADDNYRHVGDLAVGQSLVRCSSDPVELCAGLVRQESFSGVPRSTGTDVDWLGRYAALARQYGQRFLMGEDSARGLPPSRDDVRLSTSFHDLSAALRKDDLVARSRGHSRHEQSGGQPETDGYFGLPVRLRLDGEGSASIGPSTRSDDQRRQLPQSAPMSGCHLKDELSLGYSGSCASPLSDWTLDKLERKDTQEAYWDMQVVDTNNYVLVDGTIHHNSGKTRAALMRLGIMAAEQYVVEGFRESRWLITRATAPELKTLLKDFLELYPEEDGWGLLNQTPPMTFKMSVGNIRAEFIFLALDDVTDIRKLKSTQFTGAYINEGQFVTLEMFTEIKERIDRYPSRKRVNGQLVGGARNPCVIMDMNAADESHWVPIMRGDVPMPDWFTVDQQRQHAKPPDWNFLVQPPALIEIKDAAGVVVDWVLNPKADNLAFLSPDYYPDKIAGRSKEVIDMTCMNRTGALRGGKPVHTGWNKEIHVAKEQLAYKPEHELIVGLDFGRTPAAVWGQTYGRRWYILGEYYLEDVSSSEFAPALKRELVRRMPNLDWRNVKLWGDPAGDFGNDATNSTSYDIFRQHGLFVREAMAGLRITARLETVDALLARMVGGFPGLLVDSSCRMLVSGFGGGYKWKQVSGRDGMVTIDQPVKNKSSHPMDALQYLLAGAGEVSEVTLGGRAQKPMDTRVQSRVFRRDRPGAFRRSA